MTNGFGKMEVNNDADKSHFSSWIEKPMGVRWSYHLSNRVGQVKLGVQI